MGPGTRRGKAFFQCLVGSQSFCAIFFQDRVRSFPGTVSPPVMFKPIHLFQAYPWAYRAVRGALIPLWLAGMLMSIVDCDAGGSGLPANVDAPREGNGAYAAFDRLDISRASKLLLLNRVQTDNHLGVPADGGTAPPLLLEDPASVVLSVACFLVVTLALFFARCAVVPGYLRMHREALREQPVNIRMLVRPEGRFVALVLVNLLILAMTITLLTLAGGLASLPLLIFGEGTSTVAVFSVLIILLAPLVIYALLGLSFAEHAVVLRGAGPLPAIKLSWTMSRGVRLKIIGFAVVSSLVGLAGLVVGVLLFCVGVIFTTPLARVINDTCYTALFLERLGELNRGPRGGASLPVPGQAVSPT